MKAIENVGDFIREKRKNKGITQKELANQVNLSTTQMNKIEKGLARPSIGSLKEIAKVLNLDSLEMYRLAGYSADTYSKQKSERKQRVNNKILASGLSDNEIDLVLEFSDLLGKSNREDKAFLELIIKRISLVSQKDKEIIKLLLT